MIAERIGYIIDNGKGVISTEGYLYETHMHTAETSTCARESAAAAVAHYKQLGYDGIIITDHMNKNTFRRLGEATAEQKSELFLRGYHEAKKFEDENFKVLLGMEIRFLDADNDYLLFGFDESFIHGDELARISSLEEFRPTVEDNNLIIFQAHPFRPDMKISEPELLDGIEVYNGHGDHNSCNPIAYEWAKMHNLRMLSGSDYHGEVLMEKGGVYFDKKITDSHQLAAALRNGEYRLKCFQAL